MLDQIDLSRRLEAIGISKASGRKWWSKLRPRWGSAAEAEPLLEEEETHRTMMMLQLLSLVNSNGSLMAVPREGQQPKTKGLGLELESDARAVSFFVVGWRNEEALIVLSL